MLANNKRFEILDFLKGISIILIVLTHIDVTMQLVDLYREPLGFNYWLKVLYRSGYEGLRVFFVISGFIITYTTLKRWKSLDKINVRKFFRYRFARVAPALLFIVIVLSLLHSFKIQGHVLPDELSFFRTLFAIFTFHVNCLESESLYLPGGWGVLWSLSVEEVFYLLFPLLCLKVRNKKYFISILILVFILGPITRYRLDGFSVWQAKSYLSNMDSIALGCLTAFLTNGLNIGKKKLYSLVFFGVSSLILLLCFKHSDSLSFIRKYFLYESLISISMAIILITSVRLELGFRIILYPIVWFGKICYEVYLSHMIILVFVVDHYRSNGYENIYALYYLITIFVLSGLVGFLIERFISIPLNKRLRG
jgi:peptidoglycan/LPS O-acetylase OafA/YrhL